MVFLDIVPKQNCTKVVKMLSTIHTSSEWWFFCLLSCHVWNESLPHWLQQLTCDRSLLLCMMEAVKSCAVAVSPQHNYCVNQNHQIACLDGKLYFSNSFSKSTAWGCCPNYYLSYKFWKNSVRFEIHALYYLVLDVAAMWEIFMHFSLFSLAANSILKHILLHLSYKIMMLSNIAVTG